MSQGLDLPAASECSNAPECETSDWGFAKLPSIDSLFASIENSHESPFMDRLLSSRTFHSPDCSEAMAELLHVTSVLEGLQVKAFVVSSTDDTSLGLSACQGGKQGNGPLKPSQLSKERCGLELTWVSHVISAGSILCASKPLQALRAPSLIGVNPVRV